jgi:hypothetical protein
MSNMHTMNSDHELYNSSTSLDSRFSIEVSIFSFDLGLSGCGGRIQS